MSFGFLPGALLLPESGRLDAGGVRLGVVGVVVWAGAPLSTSARSSSELPGVAVVLGAALGAGVGLAAAGSSSADAGALGPAVVLSSAAGSGSVSQRKPKNPTAPRTTRAVSAQIRRPPARESSVSPVPLGVASVWTAENVRLVGVKRGLV